MDGLRPLNYNNRAHRISGFVRRGSRPFDSRIMLKAVSLALALALPIEAAAVELVYPVDVAVDAKGGIFVADQEAHALLKLEDDHFVVVAAGEGRPRTPLYGIRHIAPLKGGGFVASDPATMKLYRIDDEGHIEAIPDDNRFVTPWGVAVEPSGAILAVDRVTQRLRRIAKDGTVTDVAHIRAGRAVLFDKDGAIVVLTDKNLVRVSEGGSTQDLVKSPPFEFPHDAVLHPNGNYYVTDGYARAIWQVKDGSATAFIRGEPLVSPQGLAVDSDGNLLVADAHAKSIFRITLKGDITSLGK
jgi:sugar lactone lactonase YvrE